jgi:hypothetical protein
MSEDVDPADVWGITWEPHGENPGKDENGEPENTGGFIIYLINGNAFRKEVSRVGYVRRATKNPRATFEAQLKKEVAKARAAVKLLNENFTTDKALR